MPPTGDLYAAYAEQMQRIADVRNAAAVLQWDQETYLPARGAHYRGQQISTLTEMAHQLFSAESLGGLLKDLDEKGDLPPAQRTNVSLTLADYTKNKKYTSRFVRKLSDQTNKCFHSWIEARKHNSFALFSTDLATLIDLKKEEADLLGYEGHPYNALLDEFEKGATVASIDKTFSGLLPALQELLAKIRKQPIIDDGFLKQHFPKSNQWDWGMYLVKELNFDLTAGRQDISEHPFSISFNPSDVRITTRIDTSDFGNMTWSCIHETGHALYEQGLPAEGYGLPAGEACSYSIHESQSRLWENHVGRGSSFWRFYYPQLQSHFPGQLGSTSPEEFYRGINRVQPSLIRTEADEINYHFHVYIRYELEKQLIAGSLKTGEIPGYWNEQYQKLIGVTVPDDRNGCIQDVHWSHGSFGYFPTYSLGSFYAAQFYACAGEQIPQLEQDINSGNTRSLLQWLRDGIHAKGRAGTSEDLCRTVTGKGLDVSYFVQYLLDKYQTIYNL